LNGGSKTNATEVISNWEQNTANKNSHQGTKNLVSSSVHLTSLQPISSETHINVIFRLLLLLRGLAFLGFIYIWYLKILFMQYIYIYILYVCVEITNLVIMKYNKTAVILRFYLQVFVVNLACELCKGECNTKFPYFTYFETHMLSSKQKIIRTILIRSH
jgi:hypothetical protein